jgi:hypothetical protein
MVIDYVSQVPSNFSYNRLGDTIFDVTLFDAEGDIITKLDSSLTICLPRLKRHQKEEACLSYFDDPLNKWRCEDRCLTSYRLPNNEILWCGQTTHLTNFALLLGSTNEYDPCSSQLLNPTISWLSLGFVLGAILIVSLISATIDMRIRARVTRIKTFVKELNAYHAAEVEAAMANASPSI